MTFCLFYVSVGIAIRPTFLIQFNSGFLLTDGRLAPPWLLSRNGFTYGGMSTTLEVTLLDHDRRGHGGLLKLFSTSSANTIFARG